MNWLLTSPFLLHMTLFLLTPAQHEHGDHISMSTETDWDSPMEIDVRSMHKYCVGECIYFPRDCQKDKDDFKCTKILSIQKFNPPCQTSLKNTNATLDMCERRGHLYMISALRNVEIPTIRSRRLDYRKFSNRRMKCDVQPFIAISFTNNTEPIVVPTDLRNGKLGDVFYLCTVDDPYVTSWIKVVNQPPRPDPSCLTVMNHSVLGSTQIHQQILHTQPYAPMGSSVLWSKIKLRNDQYALGCKFVLSTKKEDLIVNFDSLDPNRSTLGSVRMSVFQNTHIKFATGFAYVRDGLIEEVVFNTTSSAALAVDTKLNDEASIEIVRIKDWNSSTLNFPTEPGQNKDKEDVENRKTQKEVKGVYELCDKKKALCYVRQDEKDCAVQRKCHYLASIESLDGEKFTKLRLTMIVQQVKLHGIEPHVHPKLWSGLGFSNDTKMGRDLVFLCVTYGGLVWTRATYNTDQQNMLLTEMAEHEPVVNISSTLDGMDPSNPHSYAIYVDTLHDLVMCKINITVPDPINIKAYHYYPVNSPDRLNSEKWPVLHFNLQKHEYYVLVAQGTGVHPPSGTINYHSYSAVSHRKFSRQIYMQQTNAVDKISASTISFFFVFQVFLRLPFFS